MKASDGKEFLIINNWVPGYQYIIYIYILVADIQNDYFAQTLQYEEIVWNIRCYCRIRNGQKINRFMSVNLHCV